MKRIKHGEHSEHSEHSENLEKIGKRYGTLLRKGRKTRSWFCAVFAVFAVVKDFFLHAIALAFTLARLTTTTVDANNLYYYT